MKLKITIELKKFNSNNVTAIDFNEAREKGKGEFESDALLKCINFTVLVKYRTFGGKGNSPKIGMPCSNSNVMNAAQYLFS